MQQHIQLEVPRAGEGRKNTKRELIKETAKQPFYDI